MIGLVRIALTRPYTFVVLALLILIVGPLAALRTPTDIFPEIRIPVIGVVWQYTGLPPDQMSGRITTPFQKALTTTVNDIEHIEANSYNGFGIIKIFFQPNVDIRTANAQVTAISQTLIKQMPPGATPPLILNYSAATVPILQIALGGWVSSNYAAVACVDVPTCHGQWWPEADFANGDDFVFSCQHPDTRELFFVHGPGIMGMTSDRSVTPRPCARVLRRHFRAGQVEPDVHRS